MTNASSEAVKLIISKLAPIQGITSKKMFGGHGLFHEMKMFGMVDSKGRYFLKAKGELAADFEEKGAEKHSRMPYYSLSDEILSDKDELLSWVNRSIAASK